jgi:hypothetical protein
MKSSFPKLAVYVINAGLSLALIIVSSFLIVYVSRDRKWMASLILLIMTLMLSFAVQLLRTIADLPKRPQRLKKAPGVRFISLVDFFYSAEDVEKTFKPIVSDWHKEYFRALAAQGVWRSRWINIKYRYRFAQAMGLCKAWQLVDKVIGVVSSVMSK